MLCKRASILYLALIAATATGCGPAQAQLTASPAPTGVAPPIIEATSVAPPSPTPVEATAVTATSAPMGVDLAAINLQLVQVVGGLQEPVGLTNAGDGSGRLFAVEKRGVIRIVQNGRLADTPFLDISDRVGSSGSEQGLLGLAFHPAYASNRYFFVNYTDQDGNTVISRFSVSADPNRADPQSEETVLTLMQPAPNHNGGDLVFGPDGTLYIGTGDGGGAGDRFHNAQNSQSLLGKMLRINVDSLPYSIPADNPFVNDPSVRGEIWAVGLRNPWRYSFDRLTGDLYIGDVGQNAYEEIDFVAAGSTGGLNFGWPIMEGLHCYPDSVNCDRTGLTLPVAEYGHGPECSVTGGYVYRGQAYPALSGVYLYGDYCSGVIWGLIRAADGTWQTAQLTSGGISLSSFGQDESGELYVLDMSGGVLYQIAAQ